MATRRLWIKALCECGAAGRVKYRDAMVLRQFYRCPTCTRLHSQIFALAPDKDAQRVVSERLARRIAKRYAA